jgi:hypothetical protein
MSKKNTKSSMPIWVWIFIILILIQIGKFAHRNDLFKKETIKQDEDNEKIIKSIINSMEKLKKTNNK